MNGPENRSIESKNPIFLASLHPDWFLSYIYIYTKQEISLMTQFEIECRCGGHSVTKKFMTILQILVAKPKLWKNLYFYKEYIFNPKNTFLAEKLKNALSRP